jgi:hypothetical protein
MKQLASSPETVAAVLGLTLKQAHEWLRQRALRHPPKPFAGTTLLFGPRHDAPKKV